MLTNREQEVFGLHIDESMVKLVQLKRRSGKYYAATAAWSQIENHTQKNGPANEQNVIHAIQKCVRQAEVKTRYAVCGLGGNDIAVRRFKFPTLSQKEIENAVLLEASQVCPFDMEKSTVAFEVIDSTQTAEETAPGTCGVMVQSMNENIEAQRRVVEKAGLKCVLMDANPFAMINCFSCYHKPQTGHAIVLVDIGTDFSHLMIIPKSGLPFIRELSHAARHIINQIAVKCRISPQEVQKSLWEKENHNQPICDAMKEASSDFIYDISETLRYYKTQEDFAIIEKIFICGKMAGYENFINILNNGLEADVRLWNPFDKIPCETDAPGKNIMKEHGPMFAVAAGLAMRTI